MSKSFDKICRQKAEAEAEKTTRMSKSYNKISRPEAHEEEEKTTGIRSNKGGKTTTTTTTRELQKLSEKTVPRYHLMSKSFDNITRERRQGRRS
jgi:hypothetical protein